MTISGPTIIRRELGRRLVKVREAAGKTAADVAASKIASRTTLHRFESGRHPVNPGTVLRLCLLYEVDGSTTRALNDLAEASHRRGWWEDIGDLATGLRFFIGLEAAAAEILTYQPDVVPGLLQTADYVRAVERAHVTAVDEETVERRVDVRLKRQQTLFARSPSVRLRAVLGAGVLARQVGGAEVMAAQVAHLRDLDQRKQIDLRMLPAEAGSHAGLAGGFTLMKFTDPDDPTVVHVETAVGSSYFELPAQVNHYVSIFQAVHRQTVSMEEHHS
jgi:transcriptional regulator with XRE-family HTH domain